MTIRQQVEDMSRKQVVAILEDRGGYQCYDSETTAELRECLITDIERGILPASVLEYTGAYQ